MNTNNIDKQNSHLDLQDKAVQDIFALYQDYAEVPYISEKRDKEDWLNAVRVRAYALLVGLAGLMILAFAYAEAMGPTGSDFLAFWSAGQIVATGDAAAPRQAAP